MTSTYRYCMPAIFMLVTIFAHAQINPSMGGLFFRENKGQVKDQHGHARPDIIISGHVNGLTFHFDKQGMHYQLVKPHAQKKSNHADNLGDAGNLAVNMDIYRVDVQWAGANPNPVVEYLNPLPGVEHFYNVPNGMQPVLHVKSYREVRYKNVYPGIDVRFYEKDGSLEYDFEVAPHANPENIRLAISGADLSVNDKDELCMKTPLGQIREGGLEVWQGSQRIKAEWNLKEEAVGFSLGNYDPAKPLLIDPPVRVWGTYFGAADGNDFGHAVTTDQNGNVYFAGETSSTTNIATSGSHQSTLTPNAIGGDVFLAKFNSSGQIQWGTYFGANGDDECRAIAVNSSGFIFIGGITGSGGVNGPDNDFVTQGAHQTTYGGGSMDGFLACFSPEGFPSWVTFYGGSGGWDYVNSVATDPEGNVYIAGETESATGIASNGAHQTSRVGDYDCFIAKFTPTGQRLWGTYFGNSGREFGRRIAVDASGSVYLAGVSNSATGISTSGTHQATYGGSNDAFLAKFTTSGTLAFCTYYGGSGQDRGNAVQVASNGDIYLAGSTRSNTGISTPGVHQASHAFNFYFDAFLVKFNASGQRQWATYCGGSFDDEAFGVGLDNAGNVYLSGTTLSTDGISTANGYQNALAQTGTPDIFIVKFNNAGVRQWGTYYGGSQDENFGQLICTPSGELFLSGWTRSDNNIGSPGAHQAAYSGGFPTYDAFLVKFSDGVLPVKLTNFDAYLQQGAVQVQWETASEINTSHFEVQRMRGNQNAWSSIGRKQSSGFANTTTKYQFTDTDIKLSGQYQYRLKMVDKDGSFSYSPVRKVNINAQSVWQVYPTIAEQKQVNVQLSAASQLNLIDMQGRVIKTYSLQAGNHRLYLPFVAGQYRLVNMESGEQKSIVIQ
ncbi:MAG: SBBP repeat-containing protein [Chitinophagaceae bacterium]|nr:SBBP repeat-containing protein [Chitinophagaceae bacterium]